VAGKVTFEDVHFEYNPNEPVLNGISFSVAPGEKIAIVGSTGAGKTTIINLLCRFYDPQGGRITVDGWISASSTGLGSGSISGSPCRMFSFSPALYEVILRWARKTLDVPPDQGREEPGCIGLHPGASGGFDHVLTERGSTLSAGQRQLLSFAGNVQGPAHFGAGRGHKQRGFHTEHLIQQALERLTERRTSLIVAHRLSTIRHVDRIIVMHHGRIAEMGSHEELLRSKGIYFNLYQLQYKEQELVLPEELS